MFKKIVKTVHSLTLMNPFVYASLYIILIPIFAAIYSLSGDVYLDYGCNTEGEGCPPINFWTHLYYSAVTITTLGYGDITPIQGLGLALGASESVLGIVLIGLFLNALSNKHSSDAQKIERERLEKKFDDVLVKIEKENRNTISSLLGGDSFPWFNIGTFDGSTNTGILSAYHEGEHPLYDVHAKIADLQRFDHNQENGIPFSFENMYTNIDVGNMIPSHSIILQPWTLENEPEQSYNIFFTARNGGFTQQLRFKKINGAWVSASKVTNKDNEILHEQIDDNYPKDENGNVSW